MQIRKWLALLVSAALALSLLAGCGGKNQSLAQVILDLLDGQYANVTVEIDPDLEADLRQAVHEGETDAEIRAALEKILGSGVNFRLIGDGQQGDSAWNLILYPGSDPDAAARSAFTEWSKVFGSLPRDGQYSAGLAMLETENGYAILVQATVDKAASRDDDDDDDDDDEPEKPYSVTMTNDKVTEVTVNASNGLENLFTKQEGEAQEITAARESGFDGVTIELAAGSYSVDSTFTTTFKGILKGKSPDEKATINITGGDGLFKQISGGTVENITFDVQKAISNTYSDGGTTRAGAVAGQNNGTIQNCDVTINGGSITANGGGDDDVYAGGIAGENRGTISNCHVKGSYKSTDDDADAADDISAANGDNTIWAGGIAGCNRKTGTVKNCSVSDCKIEAGDCGTRMAAGGLVGMNEEGIVSNTEVTGVTDCYYITATAKGAGDATVTNNSEGSTAINQNASVYAGTKIGYDDVTSGPVPLGG